MSRWTPEDLANYESRRRDPVPVSVKVPIQVPKAVSHDYKAEFVQQLSLVGIKVSTEFVFAAPRKWRSDWRVKGKKILIEFEGGLFAKGKQGHSSVTGILRDIEKYNSAALLGYTVIRIAPSHVRSGQALKWVEEAIGASK
jgi:hypothetical protein